MIQLLEPCDEQIQLMTKQCLEIVFGGLKMVTRRMLHDHLDVGKYGQANNLDCEKKQQQTNKTLIVTFGPKQKVWQPPM